MSAGKQSSDPIPDEQKAFVLSQAHKHNVKFVRLWFTDILGFLKSVAITI